MRNRTRSLWIFACITLVFLFQCISQSLAFNDIGKGNGRWKENPPACRELPLLRLPNTVILSATEIEETDFLPSHCLVYGMIEEEINFAVKLPSEWNRKLFMGGNGGFAGGFRNWGIDTALKRGYATTQTDTGHSANRLDASWALDNREAEINFGHRAVHLTVTTVKKILSKYYGSDVQYSYFEGCSRGGGEAMMESQRYPNDFDGVIAGAPAYDWTGSMGLGFVWNQQTMCPDSSPIVPNSKLVLIRNAVIERCDAIDGLMDGLIDDPRNCPFDLAIDLPACQGDVDGMDCFTSAQLAALQKIYSGPSNSNGQLYPGFLPCGAEDYPDLIGWSFWFTDGRAILQAGFGIDGPNGQYVFGEQFLKYFVYDDPTYDLHNFDFETDVRDLAHAARILNATKTNLRHFKALGHKMIMYQGWADPAITPLGTIDYYEEVLERMGGRAEVEKFFRLFMVPGMLHCSGGPGPNVADWLTALENWVEKGIEPDSIMGSSQLGDWTRPLCPYPKVAVYDGSGSIYDASNFTCENPSVLP
jgi:hypothetical protein